MNDIKIISTKKELRYVSVYDKLFKMINEKTFPEGSRLPSEPILAKELGVSRTTLRQALSLLIDDGLINNIRGKGNYITKEKVFPSTGLEKIGNPVYKSLDRPVDCVEIDFRIEPPSDYYLKILGQKTLAIVCIDRWYRDKDNYVAYTYSILPIETISKFNIDLNNKIETLKFIDELLYLKNKTFLNIKFSTSGSFTTKNRHISTTNKYYLIEESIYANSTSPLAYNKHYLPIEHSSIKIYPVNK